MGDQEGPKVAPFTFKILFLWERIDGEWWCKGDMFVVGATKTSWHAVGEQIPGELSVPIIDPVVTMDDKIMWEHGKFTAFERPDFKDMTKRYPNGERAFVDNPNIGI